MQQFIGCDAHKQYSIFSSVNEKGRLGRAVRVGHDREPFRRYLDQLPAGSPIAVESSGHWYWLVDEMERAGHEPHLVNAGEAKRRMGKPNKTDKLDAEGLAILLRNGTLPEVWIPPAALRDQRELLRLRMFLVSLRTDVKNRIHGALGRYNLQIGVTDLFGTEGRQQLGRRLTELPTETQESVRQQLTTHDFLELQVEQIEKRLLRMMKTVPGADLLKTLPTVGPILSAALALEIGDVSRFPSAEHLASYAGLVPRVNSSGGRTRMGQVGGNVNRMLKWAFVEAANLVLLQQRRLAGSHALRLYERIRSRKNHQKAIVAVARHFAEAAYWVLRKQEAYREPTARPVVVSSTHGSARFYS
jgi:transposase